MARLGSIGLPKLPKTSDTSGSFTGDIAAQGRRITGVTPMVTKAYQTKPYRYLRKADSLSHASGGVGLQRLAKGTL